MTVRLSVETVSTRDISMPAEEGQATSSVNRFINILKGIVSGTNVGSSLRFLQSQTLASGTITLASAVAGTVVKINGVKFVAVSATTASAALGEFDISGTNTAAAASLAAAINASTDANISGVVTASSSGAVVTVSCSRPGDVGNAVTIETAGVVAKGTFAVGTVSAASTVAINGVVLTATQKHASGTIVCSSVDNGDYVVIGGNKYTGVTNGSTPGVDQFEVGTGGAANTDSATNLAAAINNSDQDLVTAVASGVTVTLRAVDAGTGGNAITLSTSDVTDLAVSGTVLANGAAIAVNVFDPIGTSTQVATDLARCINASTSALISGQVWAYSNGVTVNVLALASGLAGNAVTITGFAGEITASAARLAGGTIASFQGVQATGTLTVGVTTGSVTATINGVDIAAAFDTDNTTTALALVTAINTSSNALVRNFVTAASTGTTVTITAVRGGVEGNAITLAVAGGTSTVSGARLASGAVPTTVVPSGQRLANGDSGSSFNFSY